VRKRYPSWRLNPSATIARGRGAAHRCARGSKCDSVSVNAPGKAKFERTFVRVWCGAQGRPSGRSSWSDGVGVSTLFGSWLTQR
jgi:hypothetical protein